VKTRREDDGRRSLVVVINCTIIGAVIETRAREDEATP
jgi:hypothetical protein